MKNTTIKRKILYIICLVIVSLQLKAQLSYNSQSDLFKDANQFTIQQSSLQPNDEGITLKHKLSFGIMTSMEYCRNYINDINTTILSTDRDNGFHLGLKLQYNFTEKLSVRSGIIYSEYYYNATLQIHEINDFVPYDTTYITQYKVKNMSWNIPLMLGYTLFSWNKFRFTPSAGFIFTGIRHSSTDKLYAQLNLGIEYFINKNFFITFEPFVGYNLIPAQDGFIYNTQSNLMHGGIFSVNYQL